MTVRKFTEYIADTMTMPKDVVMDLPRISICGDKEIYIENHKGLLTYTDSELAVKMKDGVMRVYGLGLRIILLEPDRFVLNGELERVEYEKIGRKLKNVQKNL